MYYMEKELAEAAKIMQKVNKNDGIIQKVANICLQNGITQIMTVARGTSDNAARYFKYLTESTAKFSVNKLFHSTATAYKNYPATQKTLCLAISQSGESIDTLEAVKMAKASNAVTLAVTDYDCSPLAKLCDYTILLNCGKELSVAATKTFTAEIAVLTALAYRLNGKKVDFSAAPNNLDSFQKQFFPIIDKMAKKTKDIDNIILLSRGTHQFLCDELRLKLAETCYKLSASYSTAEFNHGPMALIDNNRTVILFAPCNIFKKDFIKTAEKIKSLGAFLISFSDIEEVLKISDLSVQMPEYEEFSVFYYILALQRFAFSLSTANGKNPDAPRNLHKITITR